MGCRFEPRDSRKMRALIKHNAAGKALEIARMAQDMHGGSGISDEFHGIRHVINVKAIR